MFPTLQLTSCSRFWRLFVTTVATCVGCNSLFDIQDPTHKPSADDGAVACTLTSDCPAGSGQVCLFAHCSPACTADPDCTGADQRCLQADQGTGCVSQTASACVVGDGSAASSQCPSGTVCADGACYAACTGAGSCSDGHTCEAGACKGVLPGAEGSGGGAGASGSADTCGNSVLDSAESCDDGNTYGSDGCSSECRVEVGWNCEQSELTLCSPICGDGSVLGPEMKAGGCDDGNRSSGDGCSSECIVDASFACAGAPSVCAKTCGDGRVDPGEGCDDANVAAKDGCLSCAVETGFVCDPLKQPSVCLDVNECATGANNCGVDGTCTNTTGSFTCATKLSCVGLAENCGNTNDNCCVSPIVAGGDFHLGEGLASAATIATFALDRYEVTVGRFRKFVNEYAGHPADGAGAHALIANSGWQSPAWDRFIASSPAELAQSLECEPTYQVWDATGANDRLPMNCVDWFQAFAFCAWDGGRLPTEAEWEYAAAGGANELIYPWGTTAPSNTYASYDCAGDGTPGCEFSDILRVGSRPAGIGVYEQLDMAGSMQEWTLDFYGPYPSSCGNCALLTSNSGSGRVIRGGSWFVGPTWLPAADRVHFRPDSNGLTTGLRCARKP